MSAYSDEPVMVKPSTGSRWTRWLAIVVALGITASVLYVPYGKARMEKRAHHAERGARSGAVYPVSLENVPHQLELTWGPNQFAPVLYPAPAEGITLTLKSRLGTETLTWNAEKGCFGPTTFGGVDPYSHYKLSLRIERADTTLWKGSLMAYGYHDTHGHSH